MARQRDALVTVYGRGSDRYLDLVRRFPLRPLRTDADLDAAVELMDELIDRDGLSAAEQDYLDVLSDLVEAYEEVAVPIRPASDAEVLKYLLDERGMTQAAAAAGAGIATSTVSEVLAGKRTLTRAQVGKLARFLGVDPGVFAGQ